MTINPLDLTEKFPASNADAWHELVTAAYLKTAGKGSSGEDASDSDAVARALQSLTANTLDGVDIQPLYSSQNLKHDSGLNEARRQPAHLAANSSSASLDQQQAWDICQKIREPSVLDANRVMLEELLQGASSVHLAMATAGIKSIEDLQALTQGVHLNMIRVSCQPALADSTTSQLWQWWRTLYSDTAFNVESAKLSLNGNLFSSAAIALDEPDWQSAANNMIAAVKDSSGLLCNISHCAVDTREHHQLGSNNIQELAFACSAGLEYLKLFQKEGLDLQTANRQIIFHLAIDADFFTNIAKVRALRELWSHLLQQCDPQNTAGGLRPVIHAHTSLRMLSVLDADNNQLRNTIACAAAALGGADIISVEPHKPEQTNNPAGDTTAVDVFPVVSASKESRRTARNIQHVLMAESQLHRVQDPMGGSAFIEELTSQMTAAAWELFQSLEATGDARSSPLNAVLEKTGVLKKMIALSKETRIEQIRNRKLPLVGVSEFATAANDEERAALQNSLQLQSPEHSDSTDTLYRDAAVFEALRARVTAIASSSDDNSGLSFDLNHSQKSTDNTDTPHLLLACFGTPAVYRARAGFSRNLLASAGIACSEYLASWQPDGDGAESDVATLTANIVNAIKVKKLNHSAVVLCADNKTYRQIASQLARELKSAGVARVVLAGKSADAGFSADEVSWDQEIFMGCNVHDTIHTLLDALFASGPSDQGPDTTQKGAAS